MVERTVVLLKPLVAQDNRGILGMTRGCKVTIKYEPESQDTEATVNDTDLQHEDFKDMYNLVLDEMNEQKVIGELENG